MWLGPDGRLQSEFARKYVAQGREEGREEALRFAIRQLCAVLDIPWSETRNTQVARMDPPSLEALAAALTRDRVWPG